jgi:hypothetical protein
VQSTERYHRSEATRDLSPKFQKRSALKFAGLMNEGGLVLKFKGLVFVSCRVLLAACVEVVFEKAAFDFTVVKNNSPFGSQTHFLDHL